jgi:hypothetical protein
MSVDDEDDLVSGLDLAGSDEPVVDQASVAEPEPEPGPEPEPEPEPESDFGEVSDFSSLASETVEETSVEPPAVAPAAPPAAAAAPAPPAQEIGEPEDWDFFSDDAGEEPSFGSMDSAMGRVMEAVEDPSRMRTPTRDPDMGSIGSARGGRLDGLWSAVRGIGWIATCCLLGLGVARGVLHDPQADAAPITSVDLDVFEAREVRGSWLETARSTQLYAVSGVLVNSSGDARLPGTGLEVVLLSPDGSPLELPATPVALPIPQEQLRELPLSELQRAYQSAAAQLAAVRLEPGQGLAFQALFEGLPDQATGFVIQLDKPPPPLPREAAQPVIVEPMDLGLGEDGTPGEIAGAADPTRPVAQPVAVPMTRTSAVPLQPTSQLGQPGSR